MNNVDVLDGEVALILRTGRGLGTNAPACSFRHLEALEHVARVNRGCCSLLTQEAKDERYAARR
jgi:hypothetical protein